MFGATTLADFIVTLMFGCYRFDLRGGKSLMALIRRIHDIDPDSSGTLRKRVIITLDTIDALFTPKSPQVFLVAKLSPFFNRFLSCSAHCLDVFCEGR